MINVGKEKSAVERRGAHPGLGEVKRVFRLQGGEKVLLPD